MVHCQEWDATLQTDAQRCIYMQAGAKLALNVPWQDIKDELAEAVDQVKHGYWARHRRDAPATAVRESQPAALEVCNSIIASI